jgi:hypothetical protein
MNNLVGTSLGKVDYAFERAIRNFIENGEYPESNKDFSERHKNVFNSVQKIIEGNVGTEVNKLADWKAMSIVGDRIVNLMGNIKFENARKLIKNLGLVDNEKAHHYSKLLRIYEQNYQELEASRATSSYRNNFENRGTSEYDFQKKNPWADLLRKLFNDRVKASNL